MLFTTLIGAPSRSRLPGLATTPDLVQRFVATWTRRVDHAHLRSRTCAFGRKEACYGWEAESTAGEEAFGFHGVALCLWISEEVPGGVVTEQMTGMGRPRDRNDLHGRERARRVSASSCVVRTSPYRHGLATGMVDGELVLWCEHRRRMVG